MELHEPELVRAHRRALEDVRGVLAGVLLRVLRRDLLDGRLPPGLREHAHRAAGPTAGYLGAEDALGRSGCKTLSCPGNLQSCYLTASTPSIVPK